jgi:membrane protease YdiL (CAAX protease family)
MNIKTVSGYIAVLSLSFFLYSMKPTTTLFYSSLPVLMVMFPILVGHKVKLSFQIQDLFFGIGVSAVVLIPYYFILGGKIETISVYLIIYQLFSVSFPEEFFFRGFLQDSMGRTYQSVLLVSLLFTIAHVPSAFFLNDWISLLSFFPSLVMGWLYMKTNNIIPGTLFHFLANIVGHYTPLPF